jgi:hypothetical protein
MPSKALNRKFSIVAFDMRMKRNIAKLVSSFFIKQIFSDHITDLGWHKRHWSVSVIVISVVLCALDFSGDLSAWHLVVHSSQKFNFIPFAERPRRRK